MILFAVLALVVVQRLVELWYAERNTRRLRQRGALEIAAWQHPLFVALHASWLIAIFVFVPSATVPNWWLLGAFAVMQVLRIWVLASLGPYWTTRIMTVPGAPLVRRGPYRFIRHPNYAVVVCEIALLPGAFGAWRLALVFSIANALLLAVRIRSENRALAGREIIAGTPSQGYP